MQAGAAFGLALMVLAGCVQQEVTGVVPPLEDLPPGYPAKIGEVNGTLGGLPAQWVTHDYSIGAFDAAVQIRGPYDAPEFHLFGEVPGKTDGAVLRLQGLVGQDLQAGVLREPLVEIDIADGKDRLRHTSYGQRAEIVLDEVVDTGEPMGYGHVRGHFSARLCVGRGEVPVINPKRCQDVAGTFESDFQYDIYNQPPA